MLVLFCESKLLSYSLSLKEFEFLKQSSQELIIRHIGAPTTTINTTKSCFIKETRATFHKSVLSKSLQLYLNISLPPHIAKPNSIIAIKIITQTDKSILLSEVDLTLTALKLSIIDTKTYSHKFDPLQSFEIL